MISHEHQCIFIHIPKCAGTSIERVLGHLDGHTGRGGQDHRSIRMIENPVFRLATFSTIDNALELVRRARHRVARVSNARNKSSVTADQFERYFKFTFVRNPWARAYSWYSNVMRDEHLRLKRGLGIGTNFREFLVEFAGRDNLKPQTYWLKNFRGEMPLDFIGRFENLADDFQEVCKTLHLSQYELPHEIRGPGTDYRHHYDDVSQEIIERVYGEEIELFGYAFDDGATTQ